jgi:hypothetical protein
MLRCLGGQLSQCSPGYEAAYCAECSKGYAYTSRLAALDGAGAEHGDCRYFRLNGQCLQCSPQAVKIVQNTNLLFTVSMTIAMVLFPTEVLAVW